MRKKDEVGCREGEGVEEMRGEERGEGQKAKEREGGGG